MKNPINTASAPAAIGSYSQAIKVANTVYISGQIPLDPTTMELVSVDFAEQTHQVFKNLVAIAEAAGGSLDHAVKFTVYLTDLSNFSVLNDIMPDYVAQPFAARAAVEVAALPKGASIEIDAILYLD
ncbi:MAG: Rid family detoxifying hydrolase [Gammaproteobacteria bacterium]|nr:Rid family detoxifying hydrolase [Gammaproteobacteria bacterium]